MFYFLSTVFTSAFLLFMVQPIIAKQILPWFGGSSAVWTTCMVFFQMVLLMGYGYTDWVVRRLDQRKQAILHTVLVLISLAWLPIVAGDHWKPGPDTEPSVRILLLLLATVGLPYFLLSTTGPLVQAWVAKTHPQVKVYRLFALSNLASLISLLCYPPLIEPNINLQAQAVAWSGLYGLFALLVIVSAWQTLRAQTAGKTVDSAHSAASSSAAAPQRRQVVLWYLLATLGSVLLLSFTNHMTQNIASVPFLWIVPLVIYLATFILVFDVGGARSQSGWYARQWFMPLLMVLLLITAYGMVEGYASTMNIYVALPLFCVLLFVACMFCHGELAAMRPEPQHLTRFYLALSVGGAIGGLLVGVLAPLVFNSFAELPLALMACALLATYLWWQSPSTPVSKSAAQAVTAAAVGISAVTGWYLWDYSRPSPETIVSKRDFYGTLSVTQTGPLEDKNTLRHLYHGTISHGWQYTDAQLRTKPISYFGPGAGISRVLDFYAQQRPSIDVGILGLGIGVLAAYGRETDNYRIYELVPSVLDIAKKYFWYLTDAKAKVSYSLGDGRLNLERDPPQQFDMLSIDAFSSDSVPMHLMTVEALRVYQKQIKPDGAIVYNVTNRLINLAPMVKLLAEQEGMTAILISDKAARGDYYQTDFVIVTRNPKLIADARLKDAVPIQALPGLKVWTDHHNNLFDVLR